MSADTDRLDARLSNVEGRLEEISNSIDRLDTRTENRFQTLNGRVDDLDGKIDDRFDTLDGRMGDLDGKIERTETRMLQRMTLIIGVATVIIALVQIFLA
jgi:tetrahydromethanopterin S-methyltransferase subunit G